jgi:ABC-type Fe2+-enterobactin transport system substrate-binding protein
MRQALTLVFLLALSTFTNAQSDWPKTITATNGAIMGKHEIHISNYFL